jgi:hypothetical protein
VAAVAVVVARLVALVMLAALVALERLLRLVQTPLLLLAMHLVMVLAPGPVAATLTPTRRSAPPS